MLRSSLMMLSLSWLMSYLFHDRLPPEIHPLSLTTLFRSVVSCPQADLRFGEHVERAGRGRTVGAERAAVDAPRHDREDRKSTRLNSSHRCISYAVFCLKKKRR